MQCMWPGWRWCQQCLFDRRDWRIKTCTVRGYEILAPFWIGSGKESFKAGLGLDLRGMDLPDFTVVEKKPCLKNDLESNVYDLLRRVGLVDGCHVFGGIFYLIDECFDGVVGVVGGV